MTDAISRSRVLDTLESEKGRLMGGKGCDWPFTGEILAKAVDTVIDFIKQVPALDIAPVVHARWIEDGYRGIPCVCSHCGEEAHYMSIFKEQFDYDWDENLVPCGYEEIREYIKSKSCPECGARMDGEAE